MSRPPFPLSDHCDGHRFFNPHGHINRTFAEVLRWKRTSRPAPWPEQIDLVPQPPPPAPIDDTLVLTWVNHATLLLQTRHGNLLVDPVWSGRTGPFGWLGPRRVHAPGTPFESLPPLDAVLLTHDHYDHCDLATLARLTALPHAPLVLAPLGHRTLLCRAGFAPSRVIELDWWDSHVLPSGLRAHATPARHWSNRLSGPRNGRLWSGFRIETPDRRSLQIVGDTGYDPRMFCAIARRFGPPDLTAIPIGAYEPRWFMSPQHCNPAEAVQIHRDLRARLSLAVHWGTFPLTDEAREAPPAALAQALAAAGLTPEVFRVLAPGESLRAPTPCANVSC